jgi:predicted adenylyl cyclase CyaB
MTKGNERKDPSKSKRCDKVQEIYDRRRGLARIRMLIREMRKNIHRPLIVGIAGGSGSGKTSKVARRIQRSVSASKVMHMDDYFRGLNFMKSIKSNNWDDPKAVEIELLRKHLKELKAGKSVEAPIYSFRTGERVGYRKCKPADVIIVEGLFVLCDDIAKELDLKIFVEISVHGSLIRRLFRDVGRTGQTVSDIFKQFVETVYPMYKLHIEPTMAKADIIIINHLSETEIEVYEDTEIQVKAEMKQMIPYADLELLGFKKIKTVWQEDTYFTAPNWKIPDGDELMRIRKEDRMCFIAYKGLLVNGVLKLRPKIEFEVDLSLADGLEKLGYKKTLTIKKQREVLIGCGMELVIDIISGDGYFLEFRTVDPKGEAKIMDLLRKLSIDKKAITRKSYLEILLSPRASKGPFSFTCFIGTFTKCRLFTIGEY